MVMLCITTQAQVFPTIQWDKTFGGSGNEQIPFVLEVTGGGYLFVSGSTSGASGDKTSVGKGLRDIWIVRTDATGNKLWDKSYGSGWDEHPTGVKQTSDGGFIIVGSIVKTAGSNPNPGDISEPDFTSAADTDTWVIKTDASGNKIWDKRLGSTSDDLSEDILETLDGGYLVGASTNVSLPDNDVSEAGRGNYDCWLVRLDNSGVKLWDKRYGGSELDRVIRINSDSDGGFIVGGMSYSTAGFDRSEATRGSSDAWLVKIDANGNKLWDKSLGGNDFDFLTNALPTQDGGYLIVSQSSSIPGFDRTAGKKSTSRFDTWVVKLDANRNILWDKAYGNNSSSTHPKDAILTEDGGAILIMQNNSTAVSGDKTDPGGNALWLIKIDGAGLKVWEKSLDVASGGTPAISNSSISKTMDGGVIVVGHTDSNAGGDKTQNSKGGFDTWMVKLNCGYMTETVVNELSPASQDACINGAAQVILGTDDDGMYPDAITYQWQKSNDGVSGWTDIAVGILRNYLPEPSTNTTYYRRIARWECHEDISNVAVVNINGNNAPILNMGGPYYTCAGSPVTLGNDPIATGGTTPYTYLWDNATFLSSATVARPNATVSTTSIFTLTVTDANGCKKVDQALVNVPPPAFAGPNVSFCPGTSGVQIGTEPVAGLPNAVYSWTLASGGAATGLSSTSIPQPIASPTAATTTYRLTITYTNSNGTTCSVFDDVVVTRATAPTANFAGPDRTLCSGATSVLGLTGQTGFTYTWSPGLYLESNNIARPTFNPGTPFPPAVDPITYTVTATNGNCVYTDQVVVTVINANAGTDGCGPRSIGTVDLTPNVNETYTWTKLGSSTGTGNFTGATNLPMVPVSGTSSGVDTYQLTVSHGGTSCVSSVNVPPCGPCVVDFIAEGGNCLKYNGSPLRLIADGGGSSAYTYTWSPAAGLSATTGASVYLLDGVNRTYTVTKTRVADPSDVCTVTKEVNHPALSLPVFNAQDVVACNGISVNIGAPGVSGYTYTWTGPNGYTSGAANPSVTISDLTVGNYQVRVDDTDPSNTGGCFTLATVRVSKEDVVATSADWTVCSNALIKLGAPDPSGGTWTYSWTPAIASYQNGTGPTSAEPEVLVTTNTTFNVTVTNAAGCTATGTTNIVVTSNPSIANAPDLTNVCPGSTHIIGSPALPGVTYAWSPSTGLSNPNIAQPTVTVGAGGSSIAYTVVATFPGTCASTASDVVNVSAFDPDFTMPDVTYCPSGSPVNIGASAPSTGVAEYSWSPETGLSNTRIRNPTTNVKNTTVYTLTVTYTNGCIGTVIVTVTPTSSVDAGANRTICFGASTTIGNPSNNGTPTWSRVGGGTTYLSGTSGTTVTFNSAGTAPAGTYTFRASQTVGGCTVTDDVVVVVSPAVTIPSGGVTICLNGTGTMGVNAAVGNTYSWVPSTGLSSPNASRTDVTLGTAGTYEYTLFVQNSTGCVSTAQYIVTVLPTGAPLVTVPNVNACIATPFTLTPSVSPSGGSYSYVWSPATGLSNPFIENPTATVNETRTYTLSVTDNATGCAGSGSGVITIAPPGISYLTAGPASSSACAGEAVLLSATVESGYDFAYQWQQFNTATSSWDDLSDGGLYGGTTTTTLSISDNSTLNGAQYRLEVTLSACGNKQESTVATLTVNQCLKSSLGDRVWNDANGNGIQDPGETGVPGITATLYRNGVVVGTTTTDASGFYLFTNLDARDSFGNLFSYQVQFSNLPLDYVFSPQGTTPGTNGAGTATDSDVDPATGLSRPVQLAYGENLPDVDAGIHSSSLPVKLVSFNAVSENGVALLGWSTSEESNSKSFEIQRSLDALLWKTIGTVSAKGESNRLQKYQFVDAEPGQGIHYYRLKMIDLDATFAFSHTVSLHFTRSAGATIYPNPVADVLKIKLQEPGKITSLEIIDLNGRIAYRNNPKTPTGDEVNLEKLPGGIYFVKIITDKGETITQKIVVAH